MESLACSPLGHVESGFCLAVAPSPTPPSPLLHWGILQRVFPGQQGLQAQLCCPPNDHGVLSQGSVYLAMLPQNQVTTTDSLHAVAWDRGHALWAEPGTSTVLLWVPRGAHGAPACWGSVLCELPLNVTGCNMGTQRGQGPHAASSVHKGLGNGCSNSLWIQPLV